MKWQIFKNVLFAVLLAQMVFGCSTIKRVLLGHCEIPGQYDVVAFGPSELPVQATSLDDHIRDDIAERHEHKKLADDFNGFHDYVRDQCNGR